MTMHLQHDDTIAAIASPPGNAARGIVRLSGPQVVDVLQQCFESSANEKAEAELARQRTRVLRGHLQCTAPLGAIPCTIYYWPTERSYTRQPSAECHLPGAPPVLQAALRTFCQAGARLAGPGEFTLRAFLAGRLDLTQAEAVLGVIDAADQRQLHLALDQLAGGLASPLRQLRDNLLDLLADLEAGLDFVEEDIQFLAVEQLCCRLANAAEQLEQVAERLRSRRHSTDQYRVVLRGVPNAGKSSLINALAGRTAALVSPLPGTTRDYVAAEVQHAGLRLLLIDTAGHDVDAEDELARASNMTASCQSETADLQLLCIDASRPLDAWSAAQLSSPASRQLVVLTKSDCPNLTGTIDNAIATSALSGQGLNKLLERICRSLSDQVDVEGSVGGTAERCCESARAAQEAIAAALQLAQHDEGEELVAAEIRLALDELGRIIGTVYTDDVLDRIFSRFCIGK